MKKNNYEITNNIREIISNWIEDKKLVSYSEICRNFGWKKTNGDSKNAQIETLKKEYEFEYVGEHSHKRFLFYGNKNKNLIKEPLTKRGKYVFLDNIIMEKLNFKKEISLNGSAINLAHQLGLINSNFFYTKTNLENVVFDLGFPKYFLIDFIENIEKKISKILDRSLNRLSKNGYIKLNKYIIVKEKDSKYSRKATKTDIENIEKARKETITKMGYLTIEEIIKNGLGFYYRFNLHSNLVEYNIDFFYESYSIEKISKEREEIDLKKHWDLINEFNSLLVLTSIESFKTKSINFANKEKYKKISKKTYYELNKFLVECLVSKKSIYDLKYKIILENGKEKITSDLENGYMWNFLNNVHGKLYIREKPYRIITPKEK